MLKKYPILLLLSILSAHAWDDREEMIEISPETNQVHTRFYLIARLEKTIQTLYQLHIDHEVQLPKEALTFLKTVSGFENKQVAKCLQNIIQTKTLAPLFNCWQIIVTYKHIDDQSLMSDFTQLLYLMVQQLIVTKNPYTTVLKKLLIRDLDIPESVTHQVSFRFYLLKRLTKSREILKTIHPDIQFPADLDFAHKQIFECYQKIMQTGTITPLIELFEAVEQYRHINNSDFIKEFLQLIFIAHVCIREQKNESVTTPHSFEHITSLTVTELLEAIDIEIGKTKSRKHDVHIMLEENFDFDANHFAHYVYRRFYFIARLERIISLFKEVERSFESQRPPVAHIPQPLDPATIFDFDESFSFKHKRIQESIRTMQHEHNLKPLFAVWDDFITYKSIEDQLFVEEFTKEIFVISRNMLICSGICARHLPQLRSTIGLPAQQLLDIIDLYIEQFLEHTTNHSSTHLAATITPIRIPDLQTNVHIDDVIARFYHVQRLGIIFWLLNEIQEKAIPVKLSYAASTRGVIIDSTYEFTHEHIVSIIKIMEQTDSIEPLMSLLQGVQRYKYIDDATFTREYLLLTLVALQHLKVHYRTNHTMLEIRDGDIPLDRILDALDLLAQELPAILEKYELQGPLLWKEWFKKYWWVPATVGAGLALKIYLTLYHPDLLSNSKTNQDKPSRPKLTPSRPTFKPKPSKIESDESEV